MRKIIVAVMFLVLVQGVTLAQTINERRAWGYVFGGIGGSTGGGSVATFQVGGGGEGLVYEGLGLGAEAGYLGSLQSANNRFGILSIDTSHHFARRSKLVPFVSGGYSLGFRSGATGHGANFGGGVQYWLKDQLALRVEFRDHVFSSDTPHIVQFRVGLSFR